MLYFNNNLPNKNGDKLTIADSPYNTLYSSYTASASTFETELGKAITGVTTDKNSNLLFGYGIDTTPTFEEEQYVKTKILNGFNELDTNFI